MVCYNIDITKCGPVDWPKYSVYFCYIYYAFYFANTIKAVELNGPLTLTGIANITGLSSSQYNLALNKSNKQTNEN